MPSFPRSEGCRAALGHIRDNIRPAQEWTPGLDLPVFGADLRTLYAVTRAPEIVSEASRRLDADVRERRAAVPWLQVARAGNVHRHEYDGLEAAMIWETVVNDLPALLAAVEAELARPA